MKKIMISTVLCMMAMACSPGKGEIAAAADKFPHGEIPFPEIPADILEPSQRAAYVLENFWNPMDFSDKSLSCDTTFMEQNFVNFAQFYPFVEEETATKATGGLLLQAENCPCTYRLLAYLADKYLYERESDLYNETAYIAYLQKFAKSPLLDDAERTVYAYTLNNALKNRPGMAAADFSFERRDGITTSLYRSNNAPYTLLVFYDPDCDTCHELLHRFETEPQVKSIVDRGTVAVVLVDAEGDRAAWDASKHTFPSKWIVGYDLSGIIDNDTYVYPYPPSVYLLDSRKNVILKEPSVEQLIDYAQSH